MSTKQLVQELLALPLPERVEAAQRLWESINGADDAEAAEHEQRYLEKAKARREELLDGSVVGRSHDEVMAAAKRAIGCR